MNNKQALLYIIADAIYGNLNHIAILFSDMTLNIINKNKFKSFIKTVNTEYDNDLHTSEGYIISAVAFDYTEDLKLCEILNALEINKFGVDSNE